MNVSIVAFKEIAMEIVPMLDVQAFDAEFTFSEAGLDSLDTFTLFMKIEERYGFLIPEVDADKIRTFQDLLDYSNRRVIAQHNTVEN